MTGLGPSLRRLPSGDPKSGPAATGGASDGKPDGGSDAGDSLDGQTPGVAFAWPILSLSLSLLLSLSLSMLTFWLLQLSCIACTTACMNCILNGLFHSCVGPHLCVESARQLQKASAMQLWSLSGHVALLLQKQCISCLPRK